MTENIERLTTAKKLAEDKIDDFLNQNKLRRFKFTIGKAPKNYAEDSGFPGSRYIVKRELYCSQNEKLILKLERYLLEKYQVNDKFDDNILSLDVSYSRNYYLILLVNYE